MPKKPFSQRFPQNGVLSEEDWARKSDEADQLFTPGAPIEVREDYADRKRQINELIDAVKERGQHAVLFGERGVGKTSTSKIFRDLFPSTPHNVTVNRVRVYSSDDFSKLMHRIFENIKIKIKLEGKQKLVTISYILDSLVTTETAFNELSRVFKATDIPIIIIDEFHELKDKKASAQLSTLIKALSDEAVNVTIIIVGVSDNVGDLIENDKPIERCLTQVRMPRMNAGEIEQIIDKRIPKLGMEIAEEAVWRIVCLSRGLPAYAHNFTKYAVKAAIHRKSLEVSENDVELAISNVLLKTQQSNLEAFQDAVHSNKANARYKHTLIACALASHDEAGFFSPTDVIKPLSEILKREVTLADFQKHLDLFQSPDRGEILVRRGVSKKFRYRFKEPIMQPFAIMKGIEARLISPRSKSLLSYSPQRSFSI